MTRLLLFTLAATAPAVAFGTATEGPIIATTDELGFTAPKDKGKAELVEGKFGKAVRFSLGYTPCSRNIAPRCTR